ETQIAAVTPTETIDAEARPVMPTPKAKPKPPAHMLNKNKPKKPAKQPAKAQPAKKKAQPKKTEGEAQQAAIDTGDTDGQGNEGSVGAQQNTGTAQQSSSGGNPGARRDYMAQVAAILQRNKKYPRRARSRRQEGTGQLYFVVDSNGTIVASTLRKSSGHKLLDKEILTILERVGKLPPFPDDLSVAKLEMIVPIQFVMR
ncbi:MAG: TonB family protein, partial [Pseudomonadota bacterium]